MSAGPAGEIVVSGIGETAYTRGTEATERQLLMEASTLACRDAGVEPAAIDGLVLPASTLTPEDFIVSLGLRELRVHARVSLGGASAAAAVALAANLVRAGRASRILVPMGTVQVSGKRRLGDAGGSGASDFVWPGQEIRTHLEHPAGFFVPMQWYSLHANRWLYETGVDKGGMREIALRTRRHAHRNERAHFRGRELTAEQYDAAPLLTTPFCLFDICLESDGAAALLVERAGTDQSGRARQAHILGGGEGHPSVPDDLSSRASVLEIGTGAVARRVLGELGIRPDELDFAELYDCFTFIVLRQLEEIGFCGLGESSAWLADHDTGPDGDFPINTHGGLLSQAHIGGINHLTEAVKQLRGEAGEAQVERAGLCIVTGYGDFGDASLVVLGT